MDAEKRSILSRFSLTEEEKRRLLEMSEISLLIEDYDYIFSDFDPRPFSQRALSDDFLLEARRASRDKVAGNIELEFLVPKKLRDLKTEEMVRKRLHDHFNKHYNMINGEISNLVREGFYFAFIGILLMFLGAYIMFVYTEKSLLVSFMIVLLEPAGWFSFWEGLRLAIFEKRTKKPDLDFYRKMSQCRIKFVSY